MWRVKSGNALTGQVMTCAVAMMWLANIGLTFSAGSSTSSQHLEPVDDTFSPGALSLSPSAPSHLNVNYDFATYDDDNDGSPKDADYFARPLQQQQPHKGSARLQNAKEMSEMALGDEVETEPEDSSSEEQDPEWDVLIFTQQWPVTTCYHWREEDKNHGCVLPIQKEFWTIHGIWPTKLGKIGPNFCNKTADFDLKQLTEILDRLREYWPDIDTDTTYDWLWRHEWLKHGTCAALLDELNNEYKYFSQGLNWRDKYLMSNILGDHGIHPDSNNTVLAIQAALVKSLGKNPSIHCLYDNKNDVSYLAEIRICFNKTLQLTDCDGVKRGDARTLGYPGGTMNTNCHVSKPVHYPSLVPPVLRPRKEEWKFPVVNLYKLVQFIMWFTL